MSDLQRKVGRPTEITDIVVLKLVQALMAGLPIDTACRMAKIGKTTFYVHYNDDEKFRDKIDDARDFLLIKAQEGIRDKIVRDKDGEMMRWYAGRKNPDLKINFFQQNNQQINQLNIYEPVRTKTSQFLRELEDALGESQSGVEEAVVNSTDGRGV